MGTVGKLGGDNGLGHLKVPVENIPTNQTYNHVNLNKCIAMKSVFYKICCST